MAETARDTPTPLATPCRSSQPTVPPGSGFKRPLLLDAADHSSTKASRNVIDLSSDGEGMDHEPELPGSPFEDDDVHSEADDLAHFDLSAVPDVDDKNAPRPKVGEIRLSRSAINSRLRRIMKPDVHGNFKVSEAIIQDFHSAKNRKNIDQIFQMCGYDPERVSKQWFDNSVQSFFGTNRTNHILKIMFLMYSVYVYVLYYSRWPPCVTTHGKVSLDILYFIHNDIITYI